MLPCTAAWILTIKCGGEMAATPEERIARLEAQMADVRDDISEIKGDTKAIRTVIDQTKGGWKVMVMVSGLSATVGGLVVKFAPFLVAR